MEGLDRSVARLAARQHGLFTRAQARALGARDDDIDRRIGSGRWELVLPAVLRVAGVPSGEAQRHAAAALWCAPDGVLSQHTAASRYALDAIGKDARLHVLVPSARALSRQSGLVVHRTAVLDEVDRYVVDGIPVTSPARTIIDLAGSLHAEALEAAFESARRAGLLTATQLAQRFEVLGGKGRAGSRKIRALLEQVAGDVPAGSRLEVRVARALRRSGLPAAVRQHPVTTAEGSRHRLDFAWPERLVGLECDGFAWHGDRLQWKRDRRRIAAIESLGWRLVFVTWDDVTRRVDEMLHRVELALRSP
jgi:very-short-patch-repair endonuclease